MVGDWTDYAAPRADLGWYHEVGRRVAGLIPTKGRRGLDWFGRLSGALGPSPSMLRKAARFAALDPSEANMQALVAMRMDWTLLELPFSVGDEDQRHELLREALSLSKSGRAMRRG